MADETITSPDHSARALTFLFLSMFVSSVGTTLLLVGISATYLQDTGNSLQASLVYVAQYMPPIFFASVVARLCDRIATRALLIVVELATLVVSIVVGALFDLSFIAVFAFLLVRGLLDMTMKSARGVAAKLYIASENLERGNTLMNAGYYLGSGTGALTGLVLVGRLSIFEISLVNAATFAVAAAFYAGLPAIAPMQGSPIGPGVRRGSAWRRSARALRLDRGQGLTRAFLYLVTSVVVLQGINQILRVWLPIKWLGMTARGAAATELIGLAGIFVGLAIIGIWFSGTTRRVFLPAGLILSVGFLLATIASHHPLYVFVAYFGFAVFFEAVYTKSMNEMILMADREDLPFLISVFYGGSLAGMSAVVVVCSVLTDKWGLPPVLIGLAVFALFIAATIEAGITRTREAAHVKGQACESSTAPD